MSLFNIIDEIKVTIQYFMPKKIISRLVGILAAANMGKATQLLIKLFIKCYKVDMSEAKVQDISKFETFNDFFSRELKRGARPVTQAEDILCLPVDGKISQLGKIYHDAMIQAKGHYYSLNSLLGGNEDDSKDFLSGDFATIYLSPKDYHRVHMPFDGKLEKMIFVPGDLFSVNPLTAKNVDNLFSRNERVVCFFNNEKIGRFAVVLVGATIVASIATVFGGIIAPDSKNKIKVYDYTNDNIRLDKGAELGRFMLGSTVICVFEKNKIKFDVNLLADTPTVMGQSFARIK